MLCIVFKRFTMYEIVQTTAACAHDVKRPLLKMAQAFLTQASPCVGFPSYSAGSIYTASAVPRRIAKKHLRPLLKIAQLNVWTCLKHLHRKRCPKAYCQKAFTPQAPSQGAVPKSIYTESAVPRRIAKKHLRRKRCPKAYCQKAFYAAHVWTCLKHLRPLLKIAQAFLTQAFPCAGFPLRKLPLTRNSMKDPPSSPEWPINNPELRERSQKSNDNI